MAIGRVRRAHQRRRRITGAHGAPYGPRPSWAQWRWPDATRYWYIAFYFGFLAAESALRVAGVLQMLIGLAVVVGFARRWAYPLQVLLNGASLLAVMQSVIDPWGWVFAGSNALFYPSLIIFAASLLLIAYRDEDKLVLGRS